MNQKKHLYQKESNDLLKLSSSISDSAVNNSSEEDRNIEEDKSEYSNSDSHTEEIDENDLLEMESIAFNNDRKKGIGRDFNQKHGVNYFNNKSKEKMLTKGENVLVNIIEEDDRPS